METINKEKLHHTLDALIDKYESHEYVYGRLCNYMEKLLPDALENSVNIYKQREERKKQLTCDKDEFTSRFLQKNKYFYSSQSELFLHYDGVHFKAYSEDDIQHQILSTITSEQSLMDWKHKTNINIVKRIKEISPLTAIPESSTIQFVINSLCHGFFTTRNQVKYFLTIIGDCLLCKNSSLIYIISPLFKELLREISNQSYSLFGVSTILNNIKFKFYEHNYKDCRLVQFNNKVKKLTLMTCLTKHMIDLLCVAAHYSQRYGSADAFIQKCDDVKLVDHALYLNRNTTENIIDTFLERTTTSLPSTSLPSTSLPLPSTSLTSTYISHKNMIFLWKNYLEEQNIPNIIFYTALKNILKTKCKYDEDTDCYLDITSTKLPIVSKFIKFWDTTITDSVSYMNVSYMNVSYSNVSYLEVDELLVLFKQFNSSGKTNINMNENLLVDLIHHFYPDIIIIDNKYIQNINCSLWDKRSDVVNSLEVFKMKCSEQEEHTKSLNDAYEYYTSCKHLINVSKNYFERIAIELINSHIDEDGLIKSSWWKGVS